MAINVSNIKEARGHLNKLKKKVSNLNLSEEQAGAFERIVICVEGNNVPGSFGQVKVILVRLAAKLEKLFEGDEDFKNFKSFLNSIDSE